MSFNYEKVKNDSEAGSQWTSYSDLFMSLSVIFLLLYVTASLKQGTSTLQQNIEQAKLRQEVSDLQQQIKVYNSLKDEYMQEDATKDEQKVYKELMNRLTLLQDQAKGEKEQLQAKARENEEKEDALNQYQKLIKNIINTNMLSKARIKRRDQIIVKKDDVLSQRQIEIKSLERSVADKKEIIEQHQKTIDNINSELNQKVRQLNEEFLNEQITKNKLDEEKSKLKEESAKKVAALQQQNMEVTKQLSQANSTLESVNSQLENTKGERTKLAQELESANSKYNSQIAALNADFEAKRAAEKAAFDAEIKKHKMSAAARAAKEAAYKAEVAQQAQDLQDKIAGLNSKMKETEGELAKARSQADARKAIARDIQKNFAKNGIKASVDPNNGEVVIDFGAEYFDTGKADLKPGMKNVIEKAVPIYSQSLFENEKIAKKIKSVEIIGFASPTYKNKYVDPQSLNPEDRTAVDFNLDLSYNRARSIFKYIFDTNRLTFKHQRQLLPLVKVTGRSFLAERKGERDTASSNMSQKEFCESHDCAKAQRVIIKFNLDE